MAANLMRAVRYSSYGGGAAGLEVVFFLGFASFCGFLIIPFLCCLFAFQIFCLFFNFLF